MRTFGIMASFKLLNSLIRYKRKYFTEKDNKSTDEIISKECYMDDVVKKLRNNRGMSWVYGNKKKRGYLYEFSC